jgi:hypothetical protein
MVGVGVGVGHTGYPPPAPFGQPDVHLRLQGGVYDEVFVVGPDNVGESPLSGAAHLHYLGPHTEQRHVGHVPGEAPGLHPAF